MAGFFPIFFKTYWNSGVDINTSTARLGLANSLASVIVALMAPIAGAIADQGSRKKHFLTFFAYLGSSMTVGLLLVHQGQWLTATFFYIMGIIGYSGANVFYDSLLPTVATEKEYDRVSGLGFAMGYLGGGLLFALNVIMYQWPGFFGISSALILSFIYPFISFFNRCGQVHRFPYLKKTRCAHLPSAILAPPLRFAPALRAHPCALLKES